MYGNIFPDNVFPDYIWPENLWPEYKLSEARCIKYELQDRLETFRKMVETIAAGISTGNALLAKIEVNTDVIEHFPTGATEMIITFTEDWVTNSDTLE